MTNLIYEAWSLVIIAEAIPLSEFLLSRVLNVLITGFWILC